MPTPSAFYVQHDIDPQLRYPLDAAGNVTPYLLRTLTDGHTP